MSFYSNPKVKAALLATFSALALSTSMALVRKLNTDIPTTLIVFVRSCFGFIFFVPFLLKNNLAIFRTNRIHLHILRAILAVSAMLCTYYTYRNLPVAFATSIGMSGAIFTTTLSWFILKDHISKSRWLLVLTGYLGVLVVIRPTSYAIDIAIITSLLANIFAALAIITAKILSRTDSTITMMLYSNIGLVIVSGLISGGEGREMLAHQDLIILSIAGLLGVSAQFGLLVSIKISSPSFAAPFEYTRMVFAIFIGFIFFMEMPDMFTIIGAGIIILATYLLTYFESKKENKKKMSV